MVSLKNRNLHAARVIIYGLSLLLIVILLCFSPDISLVKRPSIGYLYVEPGRNSLFLEEYELTINGQDKDGVTYFPIPSFASIDIVSQEGSDWKITLEDGEILTDPMFQTIQKVKVEAPDGIVTPWGVSFLHSTNVHTIYLDLSGKAIENINHDNYIDASISVVSPSGREEYADGGILIKTRGNSTRIYSKKKPYQILLSKKAPLLGLRSAKKWALLANIFDDSNIMNKMTLDLASSMGLDSTTDSEWADLWINGEYRGLYLLCKEPYIDSGYLMEKGGTPDEKHENFYIADRIFKIKKPSIMNSDTYASLVETMEGIDEDIHSTPIDLTHIDVSTFARRYLLEEFVNNADALGGSYYFTLNENKDTIYAGPCWDYDLVCGLALTKPKLDYNESILSHRGKAFLDWDDLLMHDPEYFNYVSELFPSVLPALVKCISSIDKYAERIWEASMADRLFWISDPEPRGRFYVDPHNNIRFTKFYLYKRLGLLADIVHYNGVIPAMDFNNPSEKHTLTLKHGDMVVLEKIVPDGEQIKPETLPAYDSSIYGGWVYSNGRRELFSYYLPIYEDTELELAYLEDLEE